MSLATRRLAFTLAFLVALTAVAIAAPVKGVIKLSGDFSKASSIKKPGFWLLPNEQLEILPPLVDPRQKMIVVIEGQGLTPGGMPVKPQLLIENSMLRPLIIPIRPKTRVTIQNNEPILHLLETTKGSAMPVQRVDPGTSITHVFEKPGAYEVRCSEVPHIKATIFVTEAPLISIPDRAGAFSFPNVRAGTYTLRVWYQGQWIHGQPLLVRGWTNVEIKLEKKPEKE